VDGVTSDAHFAVELVIQTASSVLTGRYGPKEAVTLLASQGPQARARAMVMAKREPEQAASYAELLRSIVAELAAREVVGEDVRDLRAVVDDVERVVKTLTP
jgi:hypothetical protein